MSEKMPKSSANHDTAPRPEEWASQTEQTLENQRKDLERRDGEYPDDAIPRGTIVISDKATPDGYYIAGARYTISGARRNARTGKMEYHATNIATKRGAPTEAYILTEDDVTSYTAPETQQNSATSVKSAKMEAASSSEESPELTDTDQTEQQSEVTASSEAGRNGLDVDADELAAGILRINERGDSLEKKELSKINSIGRDSDAGLGAQPVEGSSQESDSPDGATEQDGELGRDKPSDAPEADDTGEHTVVSADDIALLEALVERSRETDSTIITKEELDALQGIIDKNTVVDKSDLAALDDLASKKSDTGTEMAEKATAERAEKLDAITAELDDTMIGRRLRDRLGEYAGAKAQWETKTGWIGRRKREEALKQAEAALFAAQKEYTDALVARRKEAEMYEGEESELKQMMSDDFFDEFRKLDTNARTATLEARKSMIENRKPWQRGMATVGRWLNGGKGKGWVRNALPGAAAGFGVGMAGVGIPITIVAGAAGAAGVYRMSRGAELDTRLDNYQQQTMTDEEYEKYRKTMTESAEADKDTQADRLAQEFFGRSREMGKEDMSAAKKKAASNTKKFMVGFGAGNLAANAYNLITADAAAQPGGGEDAPSPEPDPSPEDNPTDPGGETEPDGGGPLEEPSFEFPDGSSSIHAGEGWFNQFADMGFDQSQVRELFADSGLMDKLVDQGAAYPDNSATIGGYGINMPASGHLSPEVMETIRQAAISKGFVS